MNKHSDATQRTPFSKADLAQFTGSEHWYQHSLNRDILYTDGAKYVAETAGAYWLIDEIAIRQRHNKRVSGESFQVWILTVRPDTTATLTCEDGNNNIVLTKELEYTDFPGDGVTLWCTNKTIFLPSEY